MFFNRYKIEGEENDEELSQSVSFRKFYSVFNEEQLEATDEIQPMVDSPVIENTRASYHVLNIAQAVNAAVRIQGDRASYSPSRDCISMPKKNGSSIRAMRVQIVVLLLYWLMNSPIGRDINPVLIEVPV